MNPNKPFGLADKVGYALGDFGNDFTFMLSTMFLMKFYTDVMGVSAGLVGPFCRCLYRRHHGSDR